eukprot:jgi/Chrzof1/13113/Cz07g20110.t1
MIKKGQGENVVKLLCNFMETTPSTGCWSHVVSVLGELALVEGDMLAGVTSSVDDWAPHTITGSSSGSSRRGEAPSGSDAATSSNNHADASSSSDKPAGRVGPVYRAIVEHLSLDKLCVMLTRDKGVSQVTNST